MDAFTTHTGIGVPLRRSNVDTDQIIPAEYLKRVTRTGFEDGLFGNLDTMMFFVPIAKPLDNQHRFIDARWLDMDRLEPAFEGSVFLNMLSVFIEGRGADTLNFSPRQCGLEHVGGIDRSFRRSRSH